MMKYFSFLFLGLFMHSYAAVSAQNINISVTNAELVDVLSEIQKQTDLDFLYNNSNLVNVEKITLHVKNADLKTVLDRCLTPQGLSYSVKNKTVLIKRVNDLKTGLVLEKQLILKGVVQNEKGEPLVGASVRITNSNIATATSSTGGFSINVIEPQGELLVSALGYEDKIVSFKAGVNLVVRLVSKSSDLDEVVVTGYQKIDKRTFTGSVGKVNPEDLATAGSGDVGKALQGMVAGVAVENTNGTFGTKSKIRIRGNSSISGNQEPLWVIDGVVLDDAVNINPNQLYSGDASTMLSSAISGINPDDIEDIQILKDASATAMYGTQAVNGVIVVTTKRGKAGKTSINYKNNFALAIKPSITQFNVMNSRERMEFSEELYQKNIIDFTNLNSTYGAFGKLLFQLSRKEITWEEYYDNIERAKTYNTDWFNELFRNSITQDHSVSVSTGTEKAQFYMSGSYFKDAGQTINQNTDRYSGSFKGNFNFSEKFSLVGTLYGTVRNQRSFGAFNETESVGGITEREFDINPYTYARTTSRAMRPYDDFGNLEYYQSNFAPFNIIHEMNNNFIDIKLKEVRFQIDGLYKILKDLNYSFIVSARSTSALSEHISTENSNVAQSYRAMQSVAIRSANGNLYNDPYDDSEFAISVLPRGGIGIIDNNLGEFYTVRNMLNYKPVFNQHSFDLMVGSEIKQRKYNSYSFTAYGLEYFRGLTASPDYRAIQRDQLSVSGSPYYGMGLNIYRESSFFGNLAYSFKNKYNLTLSARADGSNRLGASEKFRFLPIWVLGASWNIDDETFLRDVNWLSNLKLRGSYGTRGNISGLGSPEILAYYGTTTRFNPNNVEDVISISAPENPSLQWEKEKMSNLALEVGVHNRFNLTLEWYKRNNYDLIGNIEVSRISGFNRKTMNWADMTNEGVEVTLNLQNIKNDNFKWTSILTYGYNKNIVTRMQTSNGVLRQTVDRGAPLVGRPVTGLYSFRFAHLNNDGLPYFYLANNSVSNSFSKYNTNLNMLQYEGSREPLGSGGFTNQFQYKNFSASFLFTFSYGNKLRLNSIFQRYYSDVMALDGDLANRWTTPGDELYTNIPRVVVSETRSILLSANADPFTAYNRSNIRVVDGSYIRFKNFMLGYDLPKSLTNRWKINNLRITGQAQNIALWADPNLKGQDPEAIVSGIAIPAATSYTLGLNINF